MQPQVGQVVNSLWAEMPNSPHPPRYATLDVGSPLSVPEVAREVSFDVDRQALPCILVNDRQEPEGLAVVRACRKS